MILIKYATRGRPELFKRGIMNIINLMSQTMDYRVLVSADLDDKTMTSPDIINFCKDYPKVILIHGDSRNKVHAINRDMEFVEEYPWEILVNFSDDMKFTVRSWDIIIRQRIKDAFQGSLDCFLHFNDGFVGPALATMSIIGREYYRRDKYIYHPSYKSVSCDAEAYYVAIARKRHVYFNEIIFLHNHPANHPGHSDIKIDHIYRHNERFADEDTKNYFERLNNDFDLDIPGPHPWDQYKRKRA